METREDWRKNRVIISEICRNLDVNTILSIRLVCKDWYRASKGVFATKAALNLTVPIDLNERKGWKINFGEDAMERFFRFVDFFQGNSQQEFRCENLKIGWCPFMKSHKMWGTFGPTIKSLDVFPLHNQDTCYACVSADDFMEGLMKNFPNLVSLKIKDRSWGMRMSSSNPISKYSEFDVEAEGVTYPAVAKLESLKELSVDASCFELPESFIADHMSQLENLTLLGDMADDDWTDTFYDSLTTIVDFEPEETRLKSLNMSCRYHSDVSKRAVLKTWFTEFISTKMRISFSAPAGAIRDLLIQRLPHDRKMWLSLRATDARNLAQLKEPAKDYLDRLAWTRKCLAIDFVACHPDVPEQKVTVSKSFYQNNPLVQSLCIGANSFYDIETLINASKLAELLPAASFVCVHHGGKIQAEVFGPPRLLFPNLKILVNSCKSDRAVAESHVMDFVEFRRQVGIPEDWCPPAFKKDKLFLAIFSLDFRNIKIARTLLPTFVYPEKKLVDTYQIFQGYKLSPSSEDVDEEREEHGRVILNWADPICLELANGSSVHEGYTYTVLKTEH